MSQDGFVADRGTPGAPADSVPTRSGKDQQPESGSTFGEGLPDPRDEPGSGPRRPGPRAPGPAPAGARARAPRSYRPLRFSDVLDELRTIAAMAAGVDDVSKIEGTAVAEACRRAESLLRSLDAQFLQDVVVGDVPPASATSLISLSGRSRRG